MPTLVISGHLLNRSPINEVFTMLATFIRWRLTEIEQTENSLSLNR